MAVLVIKLDVYWLNSLSSLRLGPEASNNRTLADSLLIRGRRGTEHRDPALSPTNTVNT
jgi:hypothetical protein